MLLWKKMLRDIWLNKGSYLACLVVAMVGLTAFTTLSIVTDNLELAKEALYQEQNFADGFVELVSMPEAEIERLSQTEGIRDLAGRTVNEVRFYAPEVDASVYLKLVSMDMSLSQRLNDVRVLAGEDLAPGVEGIWLDNQFFAAHSLEVGEPVEVIAGGRLHQFNIAGMGMSPEFTYTIRTGRELYPNPELFGIGFVPKDTMHSVFPDSQGTVNDVVFTLEPGADFEEVRQALEIELEPYGLKTIYPREDQISHFILMQEIEGLESVATAMPLLFLSVSALILYIMLKRLIEQQRGQIGILKAFGYNNSEIITHYLSYAFAVGIVSGVLGGILGMLLANPMTAMLMEFFILPEVYIGFSLYYFILGLVLSLSIFLLAGYSGCRTILGLKPAEAMRPPAPIIGRKTILEKVAFLSQMLTVQGKMAIRNLGRNKGRSAFMFLGIMLSCALVVLTWSFNDLIDKLVFYQYEEVETYDVRMNLTQPLARDPVMRELLELPEVGEAEPLLEVPAKLTHQWREEDVAVLGVPRGSRMYNILDETGRRLAPTEGTLILSERLADKLGVAAGSRIELDSVYLAENDSKVVTVEDVIPQYLGMNAYMELASLEDLLGQGGMATTYFINLNPERIGDGVSLLQERYQESEVVAGVDERGQMIAQTRELLDAFGSIIYVYVFVGIIIGFAIIYSSSFIILSERSREMASMRVLGMTSKEVFSVIAFEQWFLSVFAILAGLPLGALFLQVMAHEFSTDMYTMPSQITGESLVAAVIATSLSIWIAQRFALKRVEKLSLVEALKSIE